MQAQNAATSNHHGSRNAFRSIHSTSTGVAGTSGFSLIELLVVVAVMLIVAAFAVPSLVTTLDAIRMRGTLTAAANLMQRARTQAIKENQSQRIHFQTVSSQVVLFVTDSTDTATTPSTTDTAFANHSNQLWFPKQFSIGSSPTSTLTSTIMWGTSIAPNVNQDPYYSSRGLPCLTNTAGVCQPTIGFVYYFKYTSRGNKRWTAISISPAGRIESWFWNGSSWGN